VHLQRQEHLAAINNNPNLETADSRKWSTAKEVVWSFFGVHPQTELDDTLPGGAPNRLPKLPNEILVQILETITVCSATCFGLTCRTEYDLYKASYRRPPSSDELEIVKVNAYGITIETTTYLGLLLVDWSGFDAGFRQWQPKKAGYALATDPGRSIPIWHFLLKDTYGEHPMSQDSGGLSQDTKLFLRYHDYYIMLIDETFHQPTPRSKTQKEWEREATEAVIQDRQRRLDQNELIEF
jgi:hypothetical protein